MNWESSVEDIDTVTKRVKVNIPGATYSQKFEQSIARVSQSANINGFRPGRAPRQIVEKIHGERIKYEVINDLITTSLREVITKHALQMVGNPEIDITGADPARELSYTANLSIFPQPIISGCDSFDVTVERQEATEVAIDGVIQRVREGKAEVKPLQFRTSAQDGDVLDTQVQVSVEGEEPARPEPLTFELGTKTLPEHVEQELRGIEVGEKRSVTVDLPDDYPQRNLAGKRADFSVTLNALMEKILPEFSDEFIDGLGGEIKTVLDFRIKAREQLIETFQRDAENEATAKILEQVLERNPFEVPLPLVDTEIKELLVRSGLLDPKKIDIEKVSAEPFRDGLGDVARKRVRTSIAIDRLVEQLDVKVDDEDFENYFTRIATGSGASVEQVKGVYHREKLDQHLRGELARDKVVEILKSRTTITYIKHTNETEEKKV